MRAAIYTRKSAEKGLEQDFNSLDRQQEACAAYIASQGWVELPARYADGGFSGGTIERPAFQRLLREVDAGGVDVIVVHRLDRLSRSLADFVKLMRRFRDRGVALVSVTQSFDTSSATGALLLNILVSFAEFERQMASERTRDKMLATRRRGHHGGGRAPIGYRLDAKRLVVDPAGADIVRTLFAQLGDGVGLTETARFLNAQGWRTAGGQRWTRASVTLISQNRIYLGRVKAGDEWVEGQHEALIDEALFERVAGHAIERRGRNRSAASAPSLLAGLVTCSACGDGMRPDSAGKGSHRRRRYRCVRRTNAGGLECAAPAVDAVPLEAFVIEHLRERVHAGLADEIAERLEARVAVERRLLREQRSALQAQTGAAEAEIGTLARAVADLEGHAKVAVQRQLDGIAARAEASQAQLATTEARLTALSTAQADARWVARMVDDFEALWTLMTPENRQRLVQTLVAEVRVDACAGRIEVDLIDLAALPEEAR